MRETILKLLSAVFGYSVTRRDAERQLMFGSDSNTEKPGTIAEYWTAERMEAAVPEPTPIRLRGDVVERTPSDDEMTRQGFDARTPHDALLAPMIAGAVATPLNYPWRTVGKLFYTRGGTNYVASASVLQPNGVLTAAHCLYDVASSSWSTHIFFVPAYANGVQPFGGWEYNQPFAPQTWIDTGSFSWDVGTMRMRTGGTTNSPVGDIVGYLGYSVNRMPERSWIDVGYPTNYAGGTQMYAEEGAYTRTLNGGAVVGKTGTFGPGASGDPWLLYGDITKANGVHSFGDDRYPGEVFSVHFATWVDQFIRSTIG